MIKGFGVGTGPAVSRSTLSHHKYRLYVYDAEDRQIAQAMVITADNDEAATEQDETMLDGVRAELRDGDRLVISFPKE